MFPYPSLCFFIIIIIFTLSLPSTLSLNQQGLYLHQAKLLLDDPSSSLSSWNPRDDDPCDWLGITCSNSSVVSIDLNSLNLSGTFPTLLCRLPDLTFLSLSYNNINQTLPSEINLCSRLQHLDLSQNLITGALPDSLADLEELRFLDFTGNNFSGMIPESFGGFRRLEVLSLVYNLLDGSVPGFLGNVSSLKMLNLSYNPFAPGRVPAEFGNLTRLEVLWLTDCNLVGSIPDSLGRLWRLKDLDVAVNGLVGSVPDSISGLSNVVQIELYNNSLTGELPVRWSNLTKLRLLDASMNMIAGTVPRELCELPLESLNLYENRLSGSLPEAIAYSPNLYELRLFGNGLSGVLPEKLGLVSPLRWVDLSSNRFSGELPSPICEMGKLEELLLIKNRFSGDIPAGLGRCESLTRLRLGRNRFSGEVPAGLWGLPGLNLLELSDNSLSGSIGDAIGSAKNLSQFVISKNNFSGSIPYQIGFLENLEDFSAGENVLSGSLPRSIVSLQNLGRLDLHGNDLSGELPNGLESLKRLNELVLGDNKFTGKIPAGIASLSSLNYLDLSGNRFSGAIPLGIQDLKLDRLNLSYNRLSGNLPPLLGGRVYRNSFLGNPNLCGDLVSSCGESEYLKNKGYIWLLRSIFILSGVVFIVGAIWFYLKYRDFRMSKTVIDKSKWTLMSFHKLGFSEYEVLDSLDEDNVIGSGASGKVYKVVLSSGEAVAVKRLWGSKKDEPIADDTFGAEVETLGRIRHKNIVKLWCSCSTRDCKLLVYEFMPNGSLGDLLHSTKAGSLGWPTRLRIALDAAEGLAYLHHDCVPPIVHRDVKSNNILLDGNYGARVADFGVAKVVDSTAGKGAESMSVIAGSCGYIAPEYAYTLRVNEKSDIYSFGVVILELVTGRLPVDPEFGEKDLVKWVCTVLDQKGIDNVIDPKLEFCFKEEMCKLLNIGLLCTSPLPINRPSMRRVVKMLQELGSSRNPPKKEGKMSHQEA